MADYGVPDDPLRRGMRSMGPHVLLRNHGVVAHKERCGAVELLVADRDRAEERILAELGAPLSIVRHSYVTSLSYDWGHFDLFQSLEWRGVRYLDEAAVLEDKHTSPQGLRTLRLAHEAVVSWLSSLLWRGALTAPSRYVVLAAARDDSAELQRLLKAALGCRWGYHMWSCAMQGRPEASERWVRPLRRAVRRRALTRDPLQTMARWLRFQLVELRLHVRPPLPWLAVLGPDGSGKSTVLAGIRDAWPRSVGPVHIYHLRPARLTRRGGPSGPVVDPHGQPARGTVMSAAALMFVVMDWWIGYWTGVVRQRAKQGLVVFDRHLLDVLVDPRRYRYGGPSWLARAACRLVPRPDVIVVLDASPAVVRARKQEVTPAESLRQRLAYQHLAAETPGAHLVDGAVPPEQVLAAVMAILYGKCRRK